MSVFFGSQLGFLQETSGHGRIYFGLEMLLCLQNVSTKVYGIQAEPQGDPI